MKGSFRRLRQVPVAGVLAEREMGGFLAISALVGIGVGLGAAALVFLLDTFDQLLAPFFEPLFDPATHGWFNPARALVFVTVPVGLLSAWWIAKRFAPEVSGDGVPETVAALTVHGGRMRGRVGPLKVLTTALTVGMGGSAGREGPIVQVGGAVGSWISRRFGLGEDQVRSLVAAGAGAGIGAAFNAPIAGMLFALEVILSSFAARHMSSIVIASIAAAITSRMLVGPELALDTGFYRLNSFAELIPYAGLAIVVVVVGGAFLYWRQQRLEGAPPQASLPTAARTVFDLQVGDIVQYLATDRVVEGRLDYNDNGYTWTEYLLQDDDRLSWLSVEEDDRVEVALLEVTTDLELGAEPPRQITYLGDSYRRVEAGVAMMSRIGQTRQRQAEKCRYFDYEGPDDKVLSVEIWNGEPEVTVGKRIRPSSLTILPGQGRSVYRE